MYILVVDDDRLNCELVVFLLRNGGQEVDSVDNVRGAFRLIEQRLPDLLLLDIRMPGMDGFTFSERLEQQGYSIPYIYMTACIDLADRLRGLTQGAEDYVCKPFHPQELLARVQVIGRRLGERRTASRSLQSGVLTLSSETMEMIVRDKAIALTTTEMRVLSMLMHHAGHVVSRLDMLAKVWGQQDDLDSNILDVYIKRLRDKLLPDDLITTIRGIGYRLDTVKAKGGKQVHGERERVMV